MGRRICQDSIVMPRVDRKRRRADVDDMKAATPQSPTKRKRTQELSATTPTKTPNKSSAGRSPCKVRLENDILECATPTRNGPDCSPRKVHPEEEILESATPALGPAKLEP